MLIFLREPPALTRWQILILAALSAVLLCICLTLPTGMTIFFGNWSNRSGTSKTREPNEIEPTRLPIDLTTFGAFGELPPLSHPIYRTPTKGAAEISPLTNDPQNLPMKILAEIFDLKSRLEKLEASGGE